MPPVNRNEPKQAESSESRFNLMQFMREFPDDATCLERLRRTRSEDGEHTDCPRYFNQIAGHGYKHQRIHHRARIYVRGTVHTNAIEGFWSLLKRGIGGVYHSVSAKHL